MLDTVILLSPLTVEQKFLNPQYISIYMVRKVLIDKGRLELEEEVIGFLEKHVTKFGTGAKVDCPKEYLGRRVYLVVCRK
jgi:putative transposon-encoded protein